MFDLKISLPENPPDELLAVKPNLDFPEKEETEAQKQFKENQKRLEKCKKEGKEKAMMLATGLTHQAKKRVEQFIQQLCPKSDSSKEEKPMGKMEFYLFTHRPDHYQALMDSGIL